MTHPATPGPHSSDPSALPLFLTQPVTTPAAPAPAGPAPDSPTTGPDGKTPRPKAHRLAGPLTGGAATPTKTAPTRNFRDENTAEAPAGDFRDESPRLQGPAATPVDFSVVRDLQGRVIDTFQSNDEHRLTSALTAEQHGPLIRPLIETHMRDWIAQRMASGQMQPNAAEQEALRRAIDNAIFGSGRFQPLLDIDGVENIEVVGCDPVWLIYADGRIEQGPPVADTDEELIATIQQMARFAPSGEKDFSISTKKLRMALPDGSRMAAEAWMTPRPSVTIRKHRYIDTDLSQALALGTVDAGIAAFLHAAIRAGKSFVISGLPASGKTTLARAVLNELDPMVRLATIESMYELGLHQLTHRHQRVWAVEAQEGGEPGPNGHPVGAFTLTDLLQLSLQVNADRLVVGEVVGDEVMAMIQAMQGGKGSVSTMHANTAWNTVERMTTLIMQAQGNANPTFASRLVAEHIDFVVHVTLVDETDIGGGRYRFVDEILALAPNSDNETDPVEREYLWKAGADGRAVATGARPPWVAELRRHGFDPAWMEAGRSSWTSELNLQVTQESS